MGKPRTLDYPPPCSVCGEEFVYSKAPYCSCLCGSFVYKDGVLSPSNNKRGPASGSKKNFFFSSKVKPETANEYELSNGWIQEEYEET